MDLAVRLGRVPVRNAEDGTLLVPGWELTRLRAAEGFPETLRAGLRTVGAMEGARLLAISPERFRRLARGGGLCPVDLAVNRYRAVVWRYLVAELRSFGARHPELLAGRTPAELRTALDEGADFRPRRWRGRRVAQLVRLAPGPWQRAAAQAVALDENALAEVVPDAGERELLTLLRPELLPVRSASPSLREAVTALNTAVEEDEVRWHQRLLAAELDLARGAARPEPGRIVGGPGSNQDVARVPEAVRSAVPVPEKVRSAAPVALPASLSPARGLRRLGARRWGRTAADRTRSPGPASGTGPPGARPYSGRKSPSCITETRSRPSVS